MNIYEAKEEIKRTLKVYLTKNDIGEYAVPRERQRPVFVVGAPGIGKTAIMSQIAHEMQLGFVSYTITHHTRQSAIGLPYIVKREFNGQTFSVTEYTLSEIITSVYEAIEVQEHEEGILFIDEINCVSETLAPAMLELLQNKKFGPHHIPDGWILTTAGNPPEFNNAARLFDMATLDRVKIMDVDADFDVWKRYAYARLFDDAVVYYLQIKQHNLFQAEKTVDGLRFATPRGWEDLSTAIQLYHHHGFEMTEGVVRQYIRNPVIALEFYKYYLLYQKYKKDYRVEDIFDGSYDQQVKRLKSAPFDERIAVIEVVITTFNRSVSQCNDDYESHRYLAAFRSRLKRMSQKERIARIQEEIETMDRTRSDRSVPLIEKRRMADYRTFLTTLYNLLDTDDDQYERSIDEMVVRTQKTYKKSSDLNKGYLENMLSFMNRCYGENQEMVAFIIGLISSKHFIEFIAHSPVDLFYHYNEMLMVDKQNNSLRREIENVLKSGGR